VVAYIVAGLALALSATAVAEAIGIYTEQNARCSVVGGVWEAPILTLLATRSAAALAALAALVYALAAALARRSWALGACLVTGTALCVLVDGGADSGVARALVGRALGVGCTLFYPEVAKAFAVLLVAAPAACVVLLGRRARA
jgi:hypothetical protein